MINVPSIIDVKYITSELPTCNGPTLCEVILL